MRKTDDHEIIRMHDEGKTGVEIASHFGVSPAAISKRLKRLLPVRVPESFVRLTDKQKRFALAKADGKTNLEAAMSAFDCVSRESAKAIGHTLAQDPDINLALADLMAQEGLTRRHRVQRLRIAIDHPDPNVSLKGLDQSWKLEGLYTEKHVVAHINYADMTRELQDLEREERELRASLGELSLVKEVGSNDSPKENDVLGEVQEGKGQEKS
jgi:hypothetical protein